MNPVAIAGLTADPRELAPGEALIERIFATVRTALDAAATRLDDVDSVVLAADDVADGRSITTMMHATAAGAYRKDETRITNGSLTALGLASLRVATGASRCAIVASWWHPSAEPVAIANAAVDVHDGSRALLGVERLAAQATRGACAACVVTPSAGSEALELEAFTWTQADAYGWVAQDGEPADVQRRLGAQLVDRCGPFVGGGVLATSRTGAGGAWAHAAEAAQLDDRWRRADTMPGHYGIADGLVLLSQLADALEPGARGIAMATGVPFFQLAEAVAVRRPDA
jgi:hypothetical protein